MNTPADHNPDFRGSEALAPGETDPQLRDLVAMLDRLGAADRAAAAESLDALIMDRSAGELGRALEPLPITVTHTARSRMALRLTAAIAFFATVGSVYLASHSKTAGDSTLAANNPSKIETTSPDSMTRSMTIAMSTTMVRDWAAVSSLYEDNSLGADIDILSAEVSRLSTSIDDSSDAGASSAASPNTGGAS